MTDLFLVPSSKSCIFPIDTIKTRLQAGKGLSNNPFNCAAQIFKTEGIRGFYRGLAANLVGVTPEKAIKLAANEFFREQFEKDDGSIALHHEMISGAGAGFCQVIATNPMEIVKIRMQMQATLPVAEQQGTLQVLLLYSITSTLILYYYHYMPQLKLLYSFQIR